MTQDNEKSEKTLRSRMRELEARSRELENRARELGIIRKRLSREIIGKLRSMITDLEAVEGQVIGGRYLLVNLVGKGEYGEVWKARDSLLRKLVAVKIRYGGVRDYEQLLTEVRNVIPLTHKNILAVHDFGSDEKSRWWWLITEFIEGQSLQQYLSDMVRLGEWLSFEEAIMIVEQCLEALEFAHSKNIVHGDIRPSNIILTKAGEIKIADFGVAKTRVRARKARSYAAPEILAGRSCDIQTDLFSVGILAYVMLTRNHPFMDATGLVSPAELIMSKTYSPRKPSEIRKGLPKKYDKILMRLLEKDRNKRYANAHIVLCDFREKA